MTTRPTLARGVAGLLCHLRDDHGQRLDLPGDRRGHGATVRLVHAAMHNGRQHPGHFHHHGRVLHLWDQTGIRQVDTHQRT
jgi:hypothetical protein